MTDPRILVSGYYYPDPIEHDPNDPSGLSEDAFTFLHDKLGGMLDDLQFELVEADEDDA